MFRRRACWILITLMFFLSVPPGLSQEKNLPRLRDFGSDTCLPCKMMAPVLEELEKEYAGQMEVEFINIRKDKAAAEKCGVRMIPTQIFYDPSGRELFRHLGFFSKEAILEKWRELGYEFRP